MMCVFLHLFVAVTLFPYGDARESKHTFKSSQYPHHLSTSRGSIIESTDTVKLVKHLDMDLHSDSSNTQPYVSSPFTLPPFDSLAPTALPQDTPPYCETPPTAQQPPSTTVPSPMIYTMPPPQSSYYSPPIIPALSPPPGTTIDVPSPPGIPLTPYPPDYMPSPPSYTPGTPEYVPSPPSYTPGTPEYVPSPPTSVPSPPETPPSTPGYAMSPPIYFPSPSPPEFSPATPVFLPPVIYPPPSVPPPLHKGPSYALWCVAKPSVPEPIIQEAMNYACGSGADCVSIQPDGSCFQPDTLFAHASFAFNSYWQRTKVAGGTCDFGGTAILITVDPSFDGCHFIYY